MIATVPDEPGKRWLEGFAIGFQHVGGVIEQGAELDRSTGVIDRTAGQNDIVKMRPTPREGVVLPRPGRCPEELEHSDDHR
ncbi:hypothetical protein [Thiocapsa rosea]|uniref:Uncharacterized protein n=1 Tax=Thiocapsa rosea TaxID=69360 RepID=A0A495V7W2_9GAMM|nr:hypothetical protein [Thiocapsa rosea]RKT45486.1 hypothetical protein BDD21_2945 [Thiocapsa rosea]